MFLKGASPAFGKEFVRMKRFLALLMAALLLLTSVFAFAEGTPPEKPAGDPPAMPSGGMGAPPDGAPGGPGGFGGGTRREKGACGKQVLGLYYQPQG
jgi:hypothetical protein